MAQGPMAMAEPHFPPLGDEQNDDLPRTFRREKEARAREARERAAQERAAAPSLPAPTAPNNNQMAYGAASSQPAPRVEADPDYIPAMTDVPYPATVQRFEVPFMHLVTFFLKAVLAAIPALILLTAILWFAGSALETMFPELIKMKILISFPN